jgi:hypothetical protein
VQTLRADIGQHLDVKRRPSTTRRLQHLAATSGVAAVACHDINRWQLLPERP